MYFCLICESLKRCNKGIFCGYCNSKIKLKTPRVHMRFEQNIPHFYLFRWNKDSHTFCHKLVYFLKNKKEPHFDYFSELFTDAGLNISSFDTFICPQNSRGYRTNHSISLGKSLQKQFGGKSVIEIGVNDKEQKKLSRKERFEVKKNLSFPKTSKWVFIDDVLVSGATFGKIFEAASHRPKFILTLMYRPVED